MNLLKQLELDELSLVDRPANAQAKVALFKRDSNEDTMEKAYKMTEEQEKSLDNLPPAVRAKIRENMGKGMSYDEAKKMAEEDMKKSDEVETDAPMAEVDDQDIMQAAIDTLKLDNERLRKGLIDNGFVIKADSIEKKLAPEMIEVEGVAVAKSEIPEVVLKALEAAEIEKRQVELRKRAEAELPHFDAEVAMSLLEKFDDEKVVEALKGADAALGASMDEVGEKAVDADMADPQSKLDKMVEEHAAAHGVNKYAAFNAVAKTAEGKALIAKTYEKDE